jgi:hypothetical protein
MNLNTLNLAMKCTWVRHLHFPNIRNDFLAIAQTALRGDGGKSLFFFVYLGSKKD